mgnify:FL=1
MVRNWIQAVQPDVAFYQAAADNQYGHPHDQLKKRLADYNVPLYGTDELGTISIYVDESGKVDVKAEKQVEE